MTIRFKAVQTAADVRLVLPAGRHLERDGWFVAAETTTEGERLLVIRIWSPADEGYRVIVLDRRGGEHDTARARTYDDAKNVLPSLNGGQMKHPIIDGRRLVSGGDRDWEIAAEIGRINGEEILLVRVWLQTTQRVTVYAVDARHVVQAHAAAATYGRAEAAILDHLA